MGGVKLLDDAPADRDTARVLRRHLTWLLAMFVGAACAEPGATAGGDTTGADESDVIHSETIDDSTTPDSDGADALDATDRADVLDRADAPDSATPDSTADIGNTDVTDTVAPPDLSACQGPTTPLVLAGDLPYTQVGVGAASGSFLVDWGTTGSVIDPQGFTPFAPTPVSGTADRWDGFSFFGPWARVYLPVQDLSGFGGSVRQAGILGTDFLSLDIFVVDWEAATLARSHADEGCSDAQLAAADFVPLSTAGYFAHDLDTLDDGAPNVPAIPVRVGVATAQAQIDTGYDDHLAGPAVNVNAAFFDQIATADRVRASALDLVLTTCVQGVVEPVEAWRLAAGKAVELVGETGEIAWRYPDAILFVKDTPSAARVCGGIGTWSTPAAQLGVSFMARPGRVVFDPEASRVWLPRQR